MPFQTILSNTQTTLSQLVIGLSPGRTGLDPKPFYVKSVVDKMALENFFCQIFLLTHVCIVPPVLHILSSTTNAI